MTVTSYEPKVNTKIYMHSVQRWTNTRSYST